MSRVVAMIAIVFGCSGCADYFARQIKATFACPIVDVRQYGGSPYVLAWGCGVGRGYVCQNASCRPLRIIGRTEWDGCPVGGHECRLAAPLAPPRPAVAQ